MFVWFGQSFDDKVAHQPIEDAPAYDHAGFLLSHWTWRDLHHRRPMVSLGTQSDELGVRSGSPACPLFSETALKLILNSRSGGLWLNR